MAEEECQLKMMVAPFLCLHALRPRGTKAVFEAVRGLAWANQRNAC